ncbi:MAG: thioredoxin domain-containing protein [Streptosporangiales bacterium]|nr:thioredoxin domain-containing protein [Streptosporangiales bacterium]
MVGAVVLVVATVLGVNVFTSGGDQPTKAAADSTLVRADSHRLQTAKDGKVTLVEFLDFECESCRAHYPVVERLRKEYAGEITVVARYFPIPSHFNAQRAARAVESAAQQGEYEAMYEKMFETQTQWGEKRVPADATFRGFAEDLGLDMEKYDKAYDDPATLKRIQQDVTDGEKLGVQATPTFFLDGERLEAGSYEDFKGAIDAALEQ